MEVRRFTDAAEFLATAEPLLAQNEAHDNLVYGIAGAYAEDPGEEELRLWIVEDGGAPVAAALRTEIRAALRDAG